MAKVVVGIRFTDEEDPTQMVEIPLMPPVNDEPYAEHWFARPLR